MLVGAQVGFFGASGVVLSTQQVSVTIAAGATSGTATITAVSAKAAIFYGGTEGAVSSIDFATEFAGLTLTNSTTVTATRNTSDASNALIVNCNVVDFAAGAIKSIQSGTISIGTGATSNTATISSVTTTNAAVIFNGSTSTDTSDSLQLLPNLVLTDATTVTAAVTLTGFTNVAYYTVIEFNSGILNSSTQAGVVSFTSSNTTATATITSVTTGQAMIVWNGYTAASANTSLNFYPWITLTDGTTVTGTRVTGGSSCTASVKFTVIEFKAADIKSLNRGSIVIANSTASNTATISSVVTGKTIANWLGNTNSGSPGVNYSAAMATLGLTNATTLTATRGTASSATTVTVGYEAVEFT